MTGQVGGTIVEKLQSQRTLLLDVVRQIDTAISLFTPHTNGNGNGNGTTPKEDKRGSWWSRLSPSQQARITRKRTRARIANRRARAQEVGGFQQEA